MTNYFFMIKDQPTDTDWLTDETRHLQRRVICLDSLLTIQARPIRTRPTSLAHPKGW